MALSETLMKKGYSIASGGTDNHLVLWDLRPQKITGSKIEKVWYVSWERGMVAGWTVS